MAEQVPLKISFALLIIEGTIELWHRIEHFIAGDQDAAWHAPEPRHDEADSRARLGIVAESWRSRRSSLVLLQGRGDKPSSVASGTNATSGGDILNPAAFRPQVSQRRTTAHSNKDGNTMDNNGSATIERQVPLYVERSRGGVSVKQVGEASHNPLGLDAKTMEILRRR